MYDCRSCDDALRSVWLVAGQEIDRVMTVDSLLRLRYVPAGHGFPGFWEYRVEGAVRRR